MYLVNLVAAVRRAMQHGLDATILEDGRRRQRLLADLAETEEVRRVHETLEQLYQTQLVAMELAERLGYGVRA